MGIFFKGETRNINPVDTSSAGDVFSAFPAHTIPLSSLSWDEHKALQNSDIFTAITTLSKDIAKLDISCLLYTSPSPRDVEESRLPACG